MKKVLLVGPKDTLGGHGTYVNDVLKYQFKNCMVSNFNTTRKTRPLKRKNLSESFDIVHTNPAIILNAIWITFLHIMKFILVLMKERLDVILITGSSNLIYEQMFFIFFSKIAKKKVILHYHGPLDLFFNTSDKYKRLLIRFVYGCLDRLIVLSQKDYISAKNIIPEQRIIIIPNYISDNDYPFQYENKLFMQDRVVRVVFLGGSKPVRKGIKDLAKAINEIVPVKNKVRFVFCGGDDVKKIIGSDINGDCKFAIDFLGWITEKDKKTLYQDADIMVLPSYDEGMPYALIEAMASGMAIVATNIGGIPELIPSEDYGLIIEPGDINALKNTLLKLIHDESLRLQMAKNNMERVKRHYTIDAVFASLEGVLTFCN